MKNLPSSIKLLKNTLNQKEPWLILLDITLNNSENTLIRFVRNNEDITINGDGDTGLIAHYLLEETTGTNVVDDTTNDNDGTANVDISNLTTTGKIRNAYNLNGVDEYVDTNNTFQSTFGDSFSIGLWIRATDGQKVAVQLLCGSRNFAVQDIINIQIRANGVLRASYESDNLGVEAQSLSVIFPNGQDVWQHVFAVFDNSARRIFLYVNGEVVELDTDPLLDGDMTRTGVDMSEFVTGDTFYIGGQNNDGTLQLPVEGDIDDFRIYNRALTANEVSLIYNQGNGTTKSPVTYTAFNFELDRNKEMLSGEIPSLKLRISNIERTLQSYIEDLNGMVGSTCKITIINQGQLSIDYSEMEQTWDIVQTDVTEDFVDFQLSLPNLLRRRYPKFRYIANHCQFTFRLIECGYTGELLTCKRTLDACRIRENTPRFGGFPGLQEETIRVV